MTIHMYENNSAPTDHTRAKHKDLKTCAYPGCTTTIEKRKTYCGPCYDKRLQDNIQKNRAKYKVKKDHP